MLKSKKNTESIIYDELNQKMKPWLGFNSRFVSESFINEEYYDFKELYEKTHPKKKYLFYIEYFFSNILNRNVVSLLEQKKLLWLKVLFNWADALNSKSMVEVDWFEEPSKKRKAIIETMPTRNRANFEDPEGDVFTNLEIEEVANTKPSVLLPFYVTGVIYLNVIPSVGFTPDSKFPVIYAEKGLWQVILTAKGEDLTISSSGAFNSVPASIDYTDTKQDELIASLKKNDFAYKLIDKGVRVLGKAVHAQDTEKGINPIQRLAHCLKEIGVVSPTVDFITSKFALSPFAEPIFGLLKDDISGELKCNLARIDLNKDHSKLYFDLRMPVTFEMDEIITKFNETAKNSGFEAKQHDKLNSLYVSKDSPLVKTLCGIYGEETDFDTTPLSMGGATYSRAMKNFVTFGMVFPDSPKTAHLANEHITIKDVDRAFVIYGRAIHKLSQ